MKIASNGAKEALEDSGQLPNEFLARHQTEDYGDIDKRENALSVKEGFVFFRLIELQMGKRYV